MKNMEQLAQEMAAGRWLMEPQATRAYLARLEQATPEMLAAAEAAYGQRPAGPDMVGDVAVINCGGPITYRPTWFSMFFGGNSISEMQAQFRMALADPAVRVIAFRWDSPGGSVEYVPEFADELFAARGQKPIVSICDTVCASAAYWIGSQADTIYASVSSMVGAIGVFCTHMEVSGALDKNGITVTQFAHGARKLDGTPYAPLSDTAKATFQAYVDEIGAEFDAAVARGRAVSTADVAEGFGQGDVFRGKRAISLGLADKMGTFAQVMGKLTKNRGTSGSARAAVIPDVAAVAAPVEPKAATSKGCEDCDDDCPCDLDECPEDCDTCDPECACRTAAAKAAATPPVAEAPVVVDDDYDALLAEY